MCVKGNWRSMESSRDSRHLARESQLDILSSPASSFPLLRLPLRVDVSHLNQETKYHDEPHDHWT